MTARTTSAGRGRVGGVAGILAVAVLGLPAVPAAADRAEVVVRLATPTAVGWLGPVEREVSHDTLVVRGDPATLARRPGVVWAAPEVRYRAAREPSDTCWGSCPILLGGQRHLRAVGAPAAWEVTTGSPDVVVAVIDTAVRPHPELAGKVVTGPDLRVEPCAVGHPEIASHGTGVAGVIGARTDNRNGIASLGWATTILAVPVLDDCGWGTASAMAAGIRYAAAAGADVLNISASGPHHPAVAEAVAAALASGAVVVAAAGNDPRSGPVYPAAYPGVVAVGATSMDGTAMSAFSPQAPWVDVAAPGEGILSTAPVAGGYWLFSGTSFSTPLVAAAVALVRSARPAADGFAAVSDVLTAARPIAGSGIRRLDAGGAVARADPPLVAVTRTGAVFTHGSGAFTGSLAGVPLRAAIVDVATIPTGSGYWLAAADGGVFSYGLPFRGGAAGLDLRSPIVGIAAPGARGYWLAAADGGVFAFGVPYLGSAAGQRLRAPIVGMAAVPGRPGYWLAAADGGVFAFGDAPFLGAAPAPAGAGPVTGIAASATGRGYVLVRSTGEVHAFGDARVPCDARLPAGDPAVDIALVRGTGAFVVATAAGRVVGLGDGVASGTIAGACGPIIAIG